MLILYLVKISWSFHSVLCCWEFWPILQVCFWLKTCQLEVILLHPLFLWLWICSVNMCFETWRRLLRWACLLLAVLHSAGASRAPRNRFAWHVSDWECSVSKTLFGNALLADWPLGLRREQSLLEADRRTCQLKSLYVYSRAIPFLFFL